MTITANVGMPGSGKTLHAVGDTIVNALRERRLVVTNIPLIIPKLNAFVGADVSNLVVVLEDEDCEGAVPFSRVEDFQKYEQWKSDDGLSCLFVIDECHEPFADVLGNIKGDHPIVHWMAKHRHKGCDVLLITQASTEIPASMRRRVEFVYQFRKLTAVGFSNRFVKHTYYGKGSDPIDTQYGKYNSAWFTLYQSRGKGVAEKIAKQRNVLLNTKTYVIFGLVGIALTFFFSGGMHVPFFNPSVDPLDAINKKASPEGQPAETASLQADPAAPSPSQPNLTRSMGGEVVDSPEVTLLRNEVEKVRLQATLDAYKSAALVAGGILKPGGGESPEAQYHEAPVLKRHFLDGSTLTIVGHMFFASAHVYWLMVHQREGDQKVWKSSDLRQFGFTVTGIGPCNAFLKGYGEAYQLSCDGPAVITRAAVEDPPQQRVFEYDADGNLLGETQ